MTPPAIGYPLTLSLAPMVIFSGSAPVRALKLIAAALVLAGSAPVVVAQAVITEDDLVQAVREHNRALQAARAGAAAEAERPEQVRWPFPMIEGMLMPQMIAGGDVGLAVAARQQIPWAARLRADREARGAWADAATREAEALEREQVLMAHHAYTELWGLQEQRALVDSFRVRLGLYREIALEQFRAGRGPQQAVLNIEVERQMLAQRLEAIEEQATARRALIAVLTGGALDPGPRDRIAAPAAHPHVGAEALAAWIDAHPLVEAGRARRASDEALGRMVRTRLWPDLTVGAVLNLSTHARRGMFGQEVFTPSVGLMLPLWRGGVRAEIREHEQRARQRALEVEHARVILSAEAADVQTQLERVQRRIARYETELLPTVARSLEAAVLGYQTGAVRFLELLDAQRMAFAIETDLIEARVLAAQLVGRLAAIAGH